MKRMIKVEGKEERVFGNNEKLLALLETFVNYQDGTTSL